jgi:putative restriction endonuclease
LLGPQGIFKPQILPEMPLSITTAPSRPYDDRFDDEGLLQYRYRGADPKHHDNVGLRKSMIRHVPLVYLHGVVPGKYLAVWPVFVVGDSPHELTFKVAADDPQYLYTLTSEADYAISDIHDEARRAYITSVVRQRLHQRGFRERVLHAYREQCACCRLKHLELLDAAHIMPDTHPEGVPSVCNGIALCKLHHAAFDTNFLGIRPDYIIEIRRDILEEDDGPMLIHGLKSLNRQRITLPSPRRFFPDPGLLEQRYALYQASL